MTHDEPVRSPEIVNVSELRARAARCSAASLLASLALGLWLAVTLSVRDRRRELAVLRALGFGGARRAAQRAVAGHHPGRPWASSSGSRSGSSAAAAAWRYFADQLGVIPRTSVPLSWLALEVLVTAVLGWFAVALPARAAARVSPTAELSAR